MTKTSDKPRNPMGSFKSNGKTGQVNTEENTATDIDATYTESVPSNNKVISKNDLKALIIIFDYFNPEILDKGEEI
jgi:hypothetical protein